MSTGSSGTRRATRRRRPTPAFVLAALALFVALGSVAQATHPGGANTISKEDIIDGEVRQPEIQNGAVTTADISNSNGVRSEDVRDDTLDGGGLASIDVAADALTGSDIAGNSLTGSDIDESSLAGLVDEAISDLSGGCNPNTSTFVTCGEVGNIVFPDDVPDNADALILATISWHTDTGGAAGRCRIVTSGFGAGNETVIGERDNTTDGTHQNTTTLIDSFAAGSPSDPETVRVLCNQTESDIVYDEVNLIVVGEVD